jgi:hypothetical protein
LRPIAIPIAAFVWPVSALTLFTVTVDVLIHLQPEDIRGGVWSGPITILAFFRNVGKVPLAASLLMVLCRPTKVTFLLAAINVGLEMPALFLLFRRANIVATSAAVVLALWFVRRKALPRPAIVAAALASFLFVHAVGQLRALSGGGHANAEGRIETRLPTLEELSQVEWLSNNPLYEGDSYEVANAATFMAVASDGYPTLGAQLWNKLVLAYVPGQLIGSDNKASLIIGTDLEERAFSEVSYEWRPGTTPTGFVDAFQDFWYFGAMIFFLLAFILGYHFRLSLAGEPLHAIMYMSTVGLGLHSITHFSYYYFVYTPLLLAAVLFIRRSVCRLKQRGGAGRERRPIQALRPLPQ